MTRLLLHPPQRDRPRSWPRASGSARAPEGDPAGGRGGGHSGSACSGKRLKLRSCRSPASIRSSIRHVSSAACRKGDTCRLLAELVDGALELHPVASRTGQDQQTGTPASSAAGRAKELRPLVPPCRPGASREGRGRIPLPSSPIPPRRSGLADRARRWSRRSLSPLQTRSRAVSPGYCGRKRTCRLQRRPWTSLRRLSTARNGEGMTASRSSSAVPSARSRCGSLGRAAGITGRNP